MQETEIHANTLVSHHFSDTNDDFRPFYNMKLSLTPTLKCSWHVPHCTDQEMKKHRRGVKSRLFRWWVQTSLTSQAYLTLKPLVHSPKSAVFPTTVLFRVSWLLYKLFSLLSCVGSWDLTLENKKIIILLLEGERHGGVINSEKWIKQKNVL